MAAYHQQVCFAGRIDEDGGSVTLRYVLGDRDSRMGLEGLRDRLIEGLSGGRFEVRV
jgi:hypothetical protein